MTRGNTISIVLNLWQNLATSQLATFNRLRWLELA
jgi:hypothetical protein